MKERWFEARAGWLTPQLDIQVTPLEWGIGFCLDNKRVGLRLGPVAMLLWFRWTKFEMDVERI